MNLRNLSLVKTILFGLVLSVAAAMPLLVNLLPYDVDYEKSTETITLVPGRNQIGDAIITIDRSNKALHAEQINRQVTNTRSSFRNSRTFLSGGMPFLSLLAFCFFFLWYDKQQKTWYLLLLKRYTWGIFSFVSLWFLYRLVISSPMSTTHPFCYLSGIYILTALSLLAAHIATTIRFLRASIVKSLRCFRTSSRFGTSITPEWRTKPLI